MTIKCTKDEQSVYQVTIWHKQSVTVCHVA
jgi:hypothetical protein